MLLPPVFYDLAYNVQHYKQGNLFNCLVAVGCALLVSIVISLIYYITGMLDFGYVECLALALSLSTVDTDETNIENSKTMSLATNTVLILLIQIINSA